MIFLYYTIYQITNHINHKTYIGKHKTAYLDDKYFGSGLLLKRAIKKHGKENFTKDILFISESEEEMNAKEKELVTEEFCLRDDTYNICEGGQGGFSYINREKLNTPFTAEDAANANIKRREKIKELFCDPEWRRNYSKIRSEALKKHFTTNPGNMQGKKLSEEAKRKISEKAKQRPNGRLGRRWVHHKDVGCKLILSKELEHYLEKGYTRGKK